MGFDPIMMAMAKPQEIDMTKPRAYLNDVVGISNYNDIVLGLASNGGGRVEVACLDSIFWEAVYTNKLITFVYDLSALDGKEKGSILAKCPVQSVVYDYDGDYVVSISSQIITIQNGLANRITVEFEPSGSFGAWISVLVETLSIP